MYNGFIGPVHILDLIITSDGDGAYDLVLFDMFLNIILAGVLLRTILIRKLIPKNANGI